MPLFLNAQVADENGYELATVEIEIARLTLAHLRGMAVSAAEQLADKLSNRDDWQEIRPAPPATNPSEAT